MLGSWLVSPSQAMNVCGWSFTISGNRYSHLHMQVAYGTVSSDTNEIWCSSPPSFVIVGTKLYTDTTILRLRSNTIKSLYVCCISSCKGNKMPINNSYNYHGILFRCHSVNKYVTWTWPIPLRGFVCPRRTLIWLPSSLHQTRNVSLRPYYLARNGCTHSGT